MKREIKIMRKFSAENEKGMPCIITTGTTSNNINFMIMVRYGQNLSQLQRQMSHCQFS